MVLEIKSLHKQFTEEDGTPFTVLDGIDLKVQDGEFSSIMGPSGCGKSTLLNILAGIVSMDNGEIRHDGTPVSPGNLPIGYVFQEPRLLNWRTVGENIEIVLNATGVPESQHERRIEETLDTVGLRDERDSYPLRLSGGMRQRVGIARALSIDPAILLMDEPFSSLDELTARNLRRDLIDLWEETEKTILFVTHDISEAVYLSDSITFLDTNGQVFNEATVPHARPREPNDPDLLETENVLMDTFFDHMSVIQ